MVSRKILEIFLVLTALILVTSCTSFSNQKLMEEVALIKSELDVNGSQLKIIMLGADCYCASELNRYEIRVQDSVYSVMPRHVNIIDNLALDAKSFTIDWSYDRGARNFISSWKPFDIKVDTHSFIFLFFTGNGIQRLEVEDGFKEFAKIRLIRRAIDS